MFSVWVNLKCEFLRSFVPVLLYVKWIYGQKCLKLDNIHIIVKVWKCPKNSTTSHFHNICQFNLESTYNFLKYDIQQDYVSWHLIFPIKSSENCGHFVFCPTNGQNWKTKQKKRNYFHEIYGKRSQKSWEPPGFDVMTKKLNCTS